MFPQSDLMLRDRYIILCNFSCLKGKSLAEPFLTSSEGQSHGGNDVLIGVYERDLGFKRNSMCFKG